MSTREAARVFGLHRDTVRKMLQYSVPPGYRRRSPPRRPKLDPNRGVIDRKVLRLMESFRKEEVHEGVRDALRLGAVSFDAVKHLVLCRIEGRPQRLDLELYPYLPRVTVTTTSARDYMALMSGSGR